MQHFESSVPDQAPPTSIATQVSPSRAAFLIVLQPLCALNHHVTASRAQVIRAASLAPILREGLHGTLVAPVPSHCQVLPCTVLLLSHDSVQAMLKTLLFCQVIERGGYMVSVHDDDRRWWICMLLCL